MRLDNGYELTTTFLEDFSIADKVGIAAIKDTYKKALTDWKDNYIYLTELVIALNRKSWEHYNQGSIEKGKLYADLFYETEDYAYEHLKGEELTFFFNTTD